jgi:hypothetical protein
MRAPTDRALTVRAIDDAVQHCGKGGIVSCIDGGFVQNVTLNCHRPALLAIRKRSICSTT